jgi:hypothetical protein
MKDPPESVKGGVARMSTGYIDVPEWENYSFVDDEMWVAFKSTGGWLESGQTAGNDMDCCTLHAFWAHSYNSSEAGYGEWIAPTPNPPTNNLSTIEDPALNGDWCTYWGESRVLMNCSVGFPTYADELEAGAEAADNTRPSNEGWDEVAAIFHDGTWHPWVGSQTEARFFTSPEMCIEPNWGSNHAGNAIWRIC